MINVIAPAGPLCAGQPQLYESEGAEDCIIVQWVCTLKPEAVSEDDIEYSAPNSESTLITVPIEGEYAFALECCELA